MKRFSVVLLAIIVVGLVACKSRSTVPKPDTSPLQSLIASPTVKPAVASTAMLPTPVSTNTATVGGIILRETPGQPLQGLTSGRLFLAPVHKDSSGRPLMAGFDKNRDPQTMAMNDGQFIFKGVSVGVYALVFDSPAGTVVLKNPKTGEDLLIEVKGGEVINLGELRYSIPF
jgi:hypothetical protein